MTYPPPGIRFVGCGTANRPSGGPGKAPERPRAVHSTPWVVCGRFSNAARIVDRPIRLETGPNALSQLMRPAFVPDQALVIVGMELIRRGVLMPEGLAVVHRRSRAGLAD